MDLESGRMEKPRQWHAVSVIADGTACQGAQSLCDQRFLSQDAPRLPLESCSNPAQCRCRYRHYPDRRQGPRRAVENFRPPRFWRGEDKRALRGRRSTDYYAV
jgi:hypothetical protein